jgi:ferrous-iron efflux pump FieF
MKFIQFNIELEKSITLQEAHDITEEIEKKIMSQIENSEVVIHQEPK